MSLTILKQGAEGRLYLGEYRGQACLVKERFVKKYRHPELDAQISKHRIKAEVKAIGRCESVGIKTPKIFHADVNERKIYMEYFSKAITAKEYIKHTVLKHNGESARPILDALCERIGSIVGKMHANNVIHGDLTTSNILINQQEDQSIGNEDIIFVDFGLSHYNQSLEDKGVDLYVLERALLSTHSEQPYLFDVILTAYRKECGKDEQNLLSKFEEVRARGRKRTMIG
ncbi:EKC/KEOPS complex subunit TP53RK [Teleopsis dalmanni]|uniref:EKC/KEOPS complex subunit TP53RK n=1 Tax=Teleopsis dalmanni TaxID=139649 RepID=UPI0018CF47CA|nr:EKC/KEOPS complex subunit TP53RK [Teleopsis dalmanni]